MITCHLRYLIAPYKLEDLEHFGSLWIPLGEKFGGRPHGYVLPGEGADNVALAMSAFASLAAYARYREQALLGADCVAAFPYAQDTRCLIRYARSLFRPRFAA